MLIRVVLIAALVTPLMRDTNTAAEVRRGIGQYEKKQHGAAVEAFRRAAAVKPGPRTAFNLGTAQIAAGEITEGTKELTRAAEDPAVRADSLYNRGNGALTANALDQAIHDYIETLKVRPSDADAKRNLEIALLRRQASRRSQPRQQSGPDAQQPDSSNQQEPTPGDTEGDRRQQTDAESLLRSVEQQEREELSRMRRARPNPRRVEW